MSKPKKTHPWRNQPSSEVLKWATKESAIPNVRTITSARSENLSVRDASKHKLKQQ